MRLLSQAGDHRPASRSLFELLWRRALLFRDRRIAEATVCASYKAGREINFRELFDADPPARE